MSASPVATDCFPLPARLLDPRQVWASLDQGGSLLKLLFVAKEDFGKEVVTARLHVYESGGLGAALQVVRERSYVPPGARPRLNMTGVGYWRLARAVEEQLAVTAAFVDEFASQARGCLALLGHSPGEALLPPPEGVKRFARAAQPVVRAEQAENAAAMTRRNREAGLLPATFLVLGSSPVAVHVTEEGAPVPLALSKLGGLPFLGLARLLLGTADYDEVMRLAAAGDVRRVDMQVRDLCGGDADYGCFDPDLSYLPWGKLALGLVSRPRREDLAASLVHLFAQIAFNVAAHAARVTGLSRIHVTGHWARAEVARRALCQQWGLTLPDDVIEFRFLRHTAAAALGALLNAEGIDEKLRAPRAE